MCQAQEGRKERVQTKRDQVTAKQGKVSVRCHVASGQLKESAELYTWDLPNE